MREHTIVTTETLKYISRALHITSVLGLSTIKLDLKSRMHHVNKKLSFQVIYGFHRLALLVALPALVLILYLCSYLRLRPGDSGISTSLVWYFEGLLLGLPLIMTVDYTFVTHSDEIASMLNSVLRITESMEGICKPTVAEKSADIAAGKQFRTFLRFERLLLGIGAPLLLSAVCPLFYIKQEIVIVAELHTLIQQYTGLATIPLWTIPLAGALMHAYLVFAMTLRMHVLFMIGAPASFYGIHVLSQKLSLESSEKWLDADSLSSPLHKPMKALKYYQGLSLVVRMYENTGSTVLGSGIASMNLFCSFALYLATGARTGFEMERIMAALLLVVVGTYVTYFMIMLSSFEIHSKQLLEAWVHLYLGSKAPGPRYKFESKVLKSLRPIKMRAGRSAIPLKTTLVLEVWYEVVDKAILLLYSFPIRA